jgi:uncharacterized protein
MSDNLIQRFVSFEHRQQFQSSERRTRVYLNGGIIIPVCIFAKPPIAAEVKTRLVPVLGAIGAAELARAMLVDVWRCVELCPGVRPILATTAHGDFPVRAAPEDVWLQGEGDLGHRIERILRRGLLEAPAAVAVGADAPALRAAHLRAAIHALQTTDFAVGPCTDGGFYLLAASKCEPGLLASLPWSSPDTLEALKRRMDEHRLSVTELSALFDVDRPSDLYALREHLLHDPSSAPATRAWCFQNGRQAPPA